MHYQHNFAMSFNTDSVGLSLKATTYLVAVLVVLLMVKALFRALYNLLLHPVGKFPGPKSAGLSAWWEIYHTIKCE